MLAAWSNCWLRLADCGPFTGSDQMNATKLGIIGVLAMGLAIGVSGCESTDQAAAGDEPSWHWGVASEDSLRSQQRIAGMEVGTNLHRAAELVGLPVRNLEGEPLGSIYDLVLTPDLDGVSYVAVSDARGFHAIPWSAVRTGREGNIVIAVSEQEFAQDPALTEWPAEGNPRWSGRAGEPAERTDAAMAADAESILNRRFSHIEGMAVRGSEGSRIGRIQDLVVATDTGAVAYTVVSFGGFLGLGREYAAVPSNAVDLDAQQQIARIDADRETLEAYAFSAGEFPNLSDPIYVGRLNRAYGVEGGETVLGYVPGEE